MENKTLHSNETLLIDNNEIDVYTRIIQNLDNCIEFKFNVAFIVFSGVQILLDKLKELNEKNIKGKIITTNYMGTTEISALKKILEFKNIELKVYDSNSRSIGLHAKTYIFKKEKSSNVIVGSSNITQRGLKINCEWNVEMEYENDSISLLQIEEEFDNLWNESKEFDENLFINNFDIEKIILKELHKNKIDKNKIQEKGLLELQKIRNNGGNKALAIAATGTGKTYLSAFDVQQFNAKRILFLCHRWEILDSAIKSFKQIFPNKTIEKLDNELNSNKSYVFSTVQTMNRRFHEFKKNEFDYIIVDEAHHCASNSYDFIFNYFESKFLFGLTATPERYDGKDIYEKFDNNIALNVRLKDALNENLLCPFNYFGVNDLQTIDLSNVDISKTKSYEKKLMIKERVDLIAEKLKFYTDPNKKLKCLAFCASVDHAEYMANEFNKLGIKSINLDGSNKVEFRIENIKKLAEGEIEVIFCRDIFNEGIDIPEVNTILMLRPTESPTIFIQQLGRGLRKFEDKEFVTIIDFIGNHKNVYNLAFSFGADTLYDKESIEKYVKNDFKDFSKFAFFRIDKIAKEEILNKLNLINLESKAWLKNKYINFKKSLFRDDLNKIPMWLDYLNSDYSLDITKFIKISNNKSYYSFLRNVVEEKIEDLSIDEFYSLKTIEYFLPLKRNYEYLILKEILNNGFFDKNNFDKNIFINFDESSFENSINNLLLNHLDKKEKMINREIVKEHENKLVFSDLLNNLKEKGFLKKYLDELLTYGLEEYKQRVKNNDFNCLQLWEKYTRNQVLMMFNYNKSFSSFREGFIRINNNYLLMVNLDKSEMLKESYKYKDGFIDKMHFRWESQSSTTIESETGQNLINHKERNINLHLFVRKNKSKDGQLLPYYYLGKPEVLSYKGEKPIQFELKLEKIVPSNIYDLF